MSLREHEPMLAALASGAERRNRPIGAVVLSASLLVGAALFSLWSGARATGAKLQFQREAESTARVRALGAQVAALASAKDDTSLNATIYQPNPALLSTLSQSATASGMSKPPAFTLNTGIDAGALVRKEVNATISAEPLPAVFGWMERALADIPGLYVTQLTLNPSQAAGWTVEARFARWELKGTAAR